MNIPSNISSEVLAKYSIDRDNLCFSAAPKDDWKDRIQVEVGDSKDPATFQPQFKVMRWDNEVNLSVRLKDFDNYTLSTEAEKIKLKTPTKEVHLYNYPASEEHPEGGFEFEVILKEKPATNKIEFTLVDKGVEYFYQPELTEKEIKEGATRPENVVGSYAVYALENKINLEGGKLYRCGKVGHIYRPKIIDSVGMEVWGELNIDKGILSVIIPQKFLDKAVYPIRHAAGLSFGYTSNGGSYGELGINRVLGSVFTSPAGTNTANSITAWIWCDSVKQMKGLLVLHSDLNIVSNGVGAAANETAFADTEVTSAFGTAPSLTASTGYVLMAVQDSAGGALMKYDAGGANQGHSDTTNSFATPTNPTDATHDNNKYSIYCTYEAGAPPAGVPLLTLLGVGT